MFGFSLLIALHMLAAMMWVGGMGFALFVLRPSVAEMAQPLRQELWRRVLARFFRILWLIIPVVLGSGYGALYLGYHGLGNGGFHIMVMQTTGWMMVILFLFASLISFTFFKRALDRNDDVAAARALERIRQIVTANFTLGLFTVAIGAAGTLLAY